MKTQKKFDEKPLPKGWKTPPDGWVFIGMDQDLPRDDADHFYFINLSSPDEWIGENDTLETPPTNGVGVAAPAHLVRRLSTQKRAARKARVKKAEPVSTVGVQVGKSSLVRQSVSDWAAKNILPDLSKPYDEKPLPVGIATPPDGFCYVGMGVGGIRGKWAVHTLVGLQWEIIIPAKGIVGMRDMSVGRANTHYAAPAELCNRLPAKPAPVEPVKGRFMARGAGATDCIVDDIDQAYQIAEDAVKYKPDAEVYIWELRAKVTGTVNVKREVY